MQEYEISDRRVMIYPAYLDVNKTWKKGRRIPKPTAVENPTAQHIYDCVVKGLKLNAELQMNKAYPRDWMQRGRVKVELFDDDGKPLNNDVPSRKSLHIKVAELIPRHPERQALKQAQVQKQQSAKAGKSGKSAASSKSTPTISQSKSSSSTSSSKKKQGGKKKK
eukprot:TRINITY_DN10878_c0_g1_i1.p1 TRINITY_DN10878_c0_g1~~TRINITY_DN10878_c0_g1_i1.p1  ORF type:complete len:165 (+),score=18.24 TRINITY_DN10878_c0_g1_i1:52-546(+)